MTTSQLIQEVADRLEIQQVLYVYCRAMDRIDYDLGYSIWNEGAIADYGPNIYQGSGRGYIDHCLAGHKRALSHTHQITNIIIELDGDSAVSESYAISALRAVIEGKPQQILTWARYIDCWSRQNRKWGIDKRVTIRDLDEISEFVPQSDDGLGARDKSDPSYRAFMTIRPPGEVGCPQDL